MLLKRASIIFAGIAAVILAAAFVFEFAIQTQEPAQTFIVARGQNAFQVANNLKSQGYIKSKLVFLAKIIVSGNLHNLKAGEYDLKNNTDNEIINKFVLAKTVSETIIIIPGWSIADIAASLSERKKISADEFYKAVSPQAVSKLKEKYLFLNSAPPSADLEGFLAPDTYQLLNQPSADSLITMALDNFERQLDSATKQDIAAQNKSIFEIVTMASMLEKEVKTFADKKLVAGILWKRLAVGMPLQVDSTLLYYKVPGSESGQIDKNVDSNYNTYRFAGLPQGPICNPGTDSLKAAIYPESSDYWYYLNTADGTTIFSRSYGEHLINKAKYLDNL